MTGAVLAVLRAASVAFGALGGFALALECVRFYRRWRLKRAATGEGALNLSSDARELWGTRSVVKTNGHRQTAADILARAMELRSRALAMGARHPVAPAWLMRDSEALEQSVAHAGLAGKVSVQGFWDCRILTAMLFGAAGCLAGSFLSAEMGLLGVVGGIAVGFRFPQAMLEKAAQSRASDLERSLSEMLEVVALGLRSGLSFDGALALYSAHFCCPLARGLAAAQSQWEFGLVTREQALRALASSYDSILFGRVVESVVRSIRFGSSLAGNLDDAASEARAHYRTARQESVAKAPVKMMLPTSTLILPAMLILVLGPVLLELMG